MQDFCVNFCCLGAACVEFSLLDLLQVEKQDFFVKF